MAYTRPREWQPGHMVTHDDMNTYLRDNLLAAVPNGPAWTSYTPTYTNFSLGDGTLTFAEYFQIGTMIHVVVKVTLGSTSSVTGLIGVSLPKTAASDYPLEPAYLGVGTLQEVGTRTWIARSALTDADTMSLYAVDHSGTYTVPAATSSSVPHTWGDTDWFIVDQRYEVA